MFDLQISADWLIRATCFVSAASLLALWSLRKVRSPAVHRLVCVVILLQGWIWFRWDVPVLPAEKAATPIAAVIEAPPSEIVVDDAMIDRAILEFESAPQLAVEEPASTIEGSSAVTTTENIPWLQWIGLIWLGGMLLTIAVWLLRYIAFQRSLPAIDELPESYREEWHDVCQRSGLRMSIPLWGLKGLGPACGVMRQQVVVFVPTERWLTFSPEQRGAILLHEAAHLKRGDLWKSLAIRILALPQWFNPLAWRMVRRFDEAAEWACDEHVLMQQGASVPEFAEALLSLSQLKHELPQFSAAANGHPFSERMRRLLSPSPTERTMKKNMLLLFVALALCTAANLVRLSAQESPERGDRETSVDPEVSGFRIENRRESDTEDALSDSERSDSDAVDEAVGTTADGAIEFSADFDIPAFGDEGEAEYSGESEDIFTFDIGIARDGDDSESETPAVSDDADEGGASFAQPMGTIPIYGQVATEAVIDMSEVFRRSDYFEEQMAQVKARVQQLDAEFREMRQEITRRQQTARDAEGDRGDELQHDLLEMQRRMEADVQEGRQELIKAEAEVYLNTYRRVRAVIAEYAREHQIHTVRRVRVGVSEDEMNPQEVLQWINRDIVYSADEPRDITEDIIERLNRADATTTRMTAPPVGGPMPGTYPTPSYTAPIPNEPTQAPSATTTPYGAPVPRYPNVTPVPSNAAPLVEPAPPVPATPELPPSTTPTREPNFLET